MNYEEIEKERFWIAGHNSKELLVMAKREMQRVKRKSDNKEDFDFLDNAAERDIDFEIVVIPDYHGYGFCSFGKTFIRAIIRKKYKKKFLWFNYEKTRSYNLGEVLPLMIANISMIKRFKFQGGNGYRFFFFNNTEKKILMQMDLSVCPGPGHSPSALNI